MKIISIETQEIRNEFLEQMIPTLQGKVEQLEFEKMLWFLDSFLESMKNGGFIFIKPVEQPMNNNQEQPLQYSREQEHVVVPEQIEVDESYIDEDSEPLTEEELEAQEAYQQKMAEAELPKKPINFNERIKAMRTPLRSSEEEDE